MDGNGTLHCMSSLSSERISTFHEIEVHIFPSVKKLTTSHIVFGSPIGPEYRKYFQNSIIHVIRHLLN